MPFEVLAAADEERDDCYFFCYEASKPAIYATDIPHFMDSVCMLLLVQCWNLLECKFKGKLHVF